MKIRKGWCAVAGMSMLAIATAGAYAQGQQSGARAGDQSRQTDADRMQDRDRMMDRDMDRTMDRDMTRDQDYDRDRDRIREQDRDRIYASELMTEQERAEYRDRLRTLATEKERVAYRLEHQQQMQDRARQLGTPAPAGLSRNQIVDQERARQREREQVYGYTLLTEKELNQYREKLRMAATEEERVQIRAEHRKDVEERARERGVTLPPPGAGSP